MLKEGGGEEKETFSVLGKNVSFHKNTDFLARHCFLCLTYLASACEDNLNKDDYK